MKKAAFESTKKKEIGVSDLTLLSKVSNEAINDNLKLRFENKEIYVRRTPVRRRFFFFFSLLVADIGICRLISDMCWCLSTRFEIVCRKRLRPLCRRAQLTNDCPVGIYTDQVLESYRGKNRLEVPPHVFAIAESAYYNMNAYKDNQCVIISGESGAGKTEAAKRLMQYIANVSGGSDSSIQQTKEMVLATNPLLESFGNAKTLRNNNSSRFGKYLELEFNAQGEPIGAKITNYLLEKTRVVSQITNERNFHIFYQLTKAAPQAYRGEHTLVQKQLYSKLTNRPLYYR